MTAVQECRRGGGTVAAARSFGHRPSVYRREMRRPEAAVHSLSVKRLAKAAGLREAALLRRALRGELDAEHANGLIAWLLEVYGGGAADAV